MFDAGQFADEARTAGDEQRIVAYFALIGESAAAALTESGDACRQELDALSGHEWPQIAA